VIRLSREFLGKALETRRVRVGGDVPEEVQSVCTDSRADVQDKLFVALVGENFDGHRFVQDVLGRGAAAALVQPDRTDAGPERLIAVDDTLGALQDLAAAHLERMSARRVALTGSNGKTTTKELLASCLRAVAGHDAVLATKGNLNNHIGLPLTALEVEEGHRAAVLEMGMNHLGEIERLCEIARPEVGLVTNIGNAHAGPLGGIEGVAKAKGELFAGLAAGGVGVVNLDDERCVAQADKHLAGERVTFGRSEDADVQLLSVRSHEESGLVIELRHGEAQVRVRVPYEGEHNAQNAAGAVAAAVAMGFDFETAARGLEASESVGGRLSRLRLSSGAIVLDDTYNANPDSMRAGFAALAELAGARPRSVALGDMLELGDDAEQQHEAIGAAAVESGAGRVFACGELAEAYRRGALGAGLDDAAVVTAEDSVSLADAVARAVAADDVWLVKGSRGARMERVVERLTDEEDS
jgi:UDP-N-acetylmuramoyl-tripeptide--D-alanyl-D-alanine ligase